MKRIAINVGGGYVPGLNDVVRGAVLAANELGWETVGIRDGFEGLLFPDRYPDGGTITATPDLLEKIGTAGGIIGTATRVDPFRVRTVNAEGQIEEVDRSDELLQMLRKRGIDAVISIVGPNALSIAWKLHRKGLSIVTVPKSVENDIAATTLSFGFNTALSYVTETLERVRVATQSTRRIGVVEVLGRHSGWLALQSGMAVCADAVLIPEIPYDLNKIARKLTRKLRAGGVSGLVVAAEGAEPIAGAHADDTSSARELDLRTALSPLSDPSLGQGESVIYRSGLVAETVALKLQRLANHETFPLVLGQLVRGGAPTAVDRQLGLGYGAGAVEALERNQTGTMVVFQPPDLKFVPLTEAINRVRTVPADSPFVKIARALGISLGD